MFYDLRNILALAYSLALSIATVLNVKTAILAVEKVTTG